MKKICGAALLIGLLSFASACADEGPAAAPVETGDVSLDATVDGGSQDAAADLTVNELPPDVVSDGVGDVGPDIVEIIEPEVTMDVPPEVEDVGDLSNGRNKFVKPQGWLEVFLKVFQE